MTKEKDDIINYFKANNLEFKYNIPKGWYQILHDLLEEILKTNWNRDIRDIKSKFGGLRFDVGVADVTIHDTIDKYRLLSLKTCEVCGKTGKNRLVDGWYSTLCDEHYNLKINKNEN